MPGLRIEKLKLPKRRGVVLARRLRREWCFFRVLLREFRFGFLTALAALAGGALAVAAAEPGLPIADAAWKAWTLVLGELPEGFPDRALLRAAVIVLPLLGAAAIIQGMTHFALALRDRQRNERSWSAAMALGSRNHVILVGLGRLGYRCWRLLHELGETVVVIERDSASPFLAAVRQAGAAVLVGDARSDELLAQANVADAKSIVLATDEDMSNLEAALDARRMNPSIRVVLRLFDQNLADKVREGFGIHIALSQSAVAAATFAMPAFDPSIVNSFVVDDELFVMQRWDVAEGSPLAGLSVGDIRDRHGFGVVKVTRGSADASVFPDPALRLAPGDRLLVQAPFAALAALRASGECPDFVWRPPRPAPAAT